MWVDFLSHVVQELRRSIARAVGPPTGESQCWGPGNMYCSEEDGLSQGII